MVLFLYNQLKYLVLILKVKNTNNLKKFQFVMIDEKKTWFKYPGVEDKGSRPYLVVRSNIYGNLFMACPVTDVKTVMKTDKNIRKAYLKIEYSNQESYVKMNLPLVFHNQLINDGIVTSVDRHLNKSLRNVALRLLKESFDD